MSGIVDPINLQMQHCSNIEVRKQQEGWEVPRQGEHQAQKVWTNLDDLTHLGATPSTPLLLRGGVPSART